MTAEIRGNGQRIENILCLGCACHCDDLSIEVGEDSIIQADVSCSIGRAWFGSARDLCDETPTLSGRPTTIETAVERGVEILRGAKAPVVWGLAWASVEAQRVAVAIAQRIGAAVATSGANLARLRAVQRIGEVSATYGEVKDRADVIVHGSSTISEMLPRFRERYADDATGRFIPQGRAGRYVIHVGDGDRSEIGLATFANFVVPTRGPATAVYTTLRAIVRGVGVDASRVELATGVTLDALARLADRLKAARYGAFVGSMNTSDSAEIESLLALVRDLNAFTRFVVIFPGRDGSNVSGAESVIAWRSGTAGDMDFGLGYPRDLPGDGAEERLARGEVDAVLIVAPADQSFPARLTGVLGTIPRVVVRAGGWTTGRGPFATNRRIMLDADVSIPTAFPGLDEGGTVARADGVMLPLRPPFAGRRISQLEVLRAIEARLKAKGGVGV